MLSVRLLVAAKAKTLLGACLKRDNHVSSLMLNMSHNTAGGLNEYVWQAWAHLEAKLGNVGQARKVLSGDPSNRKHPLNAYRPILT